MADPKQIVLASKSARRRFLTGELGLNVLYVDTVLEESAQVELEDPKDYVLRLAINKAEAISDKYPKSLIIGADTTVVLENQVMGKPQNTDEAWKMLTNLQGKTHNVITGMTILDVVSGKHIGTVVSSLVSMRALPTELISDYVASGSPMDKAGAYGIQDHDFNLATVLEGCYNNVVGLPLCTLSEMLQDFKIKSSLKTHSKVTKNCRDCPLNKANKQ